MRPRIPRDEYPKRWAKVQHVLEEMNLDAIIAYADDRATYGAAYARYFADFPVHFEPVLLLFVRGRDPMLLIGPETVGYCEKPGTIKDIRVLKEFSHEDEDYEFTTVEPLKEVLGSAGRSIKRLGLASLTLMGADIYNAILAACPDAEIVRADRQLDSLRGTKSPAEIEVIRYAYEIAHKGMTAAIDAVRPGVTEREIAAKAEYAMRMAGSEGTGIDTIVASGENTKYVLARTTFDTVKENDVVIITVAPRYEGYHGAIARTVIVGDPGDVVVKSIESGVLAQKTCGAALKAGRPGREVEAIGRSIMTEAGYGENFMYSGLHSIGIVEFEPPILGPSSDTVLCDNMVISIDIPLFEAEITGSRTEDGYLLAGGKVEKLTSIEGLIRR